MTTMKMIDTIKDSFSQKFKFPTNAPSVAPLGEQLKNDNFQRLLGYQDGDKNGQLFARIVISLIFHIEIQKGVKNSN